MLLQTEVLLARAKALPPNGPSIHCETREFADEQTAIGSFGEAEAPNNFCAARDRQNVSVYVTGLKERLRSDHTLGVLETPQNAAVANLGCYLEIQRAKWYKFCSLMLEGLGGECR